jgi:hypothetical protein
MVMACKYGVVGKAGLKPYLQRVDPQPDNRGVCLVDHSCNLGCYYFRTVRSDEVPDLLLDISKLSLSMQYKYGYKSTSIGLPATLIVDT